MIEVASNNICVGCGACAVVNSKVSIVRDKYGMPRANLTDVDRDGLKFIASICPVSSVSDNEDVLGVELFPRAKNFDSGIGKYESLHAGRVSDDSVVRGSSSGGLTTWLLVELLARGEIDGVVHVGKDGGDEGDLFGFCVSSSVEEVLENRKSQYYAASFDGAVRQALATTKRYAFVGVPCHVKALRLLSKHDVSVRNSFPFVIGLVCGHLKSPAFAELLAWQLGIPPRDLAAVDFRVKAPGKQVHEYLFSATDKSGAKHERTSSKLFGALWGHAAFQLEACDYCDDIFAETADVCFGDAWLPKYANEWRGTNVVVVRNAAIGEIFVGGKERGDVSFEPLSPRDLVESNAGNFRHRRDGLSFRLEEKVRAGTWAPIKRVLPGSVGLTRRRRSIVRLRQRMSTLSHESFLRAKSKDDLNLYFLDMSPYAEKMARLSRVSVFERIVRKAFRVLGRIFG
ncbi:Coenzyme F420 hydrogenase/dehydrogenase, beta subunit C-terminal domain [Denitromonas ohlonensis]|nr:Coenzyme F420 hydrogenase/dehydrogenase, beta subunit C-terminal domain [Denitromonas ohlonensis]